MAKKFGCGSVTAILIVCLFIIAVATNEVAGMIFSRCGEEDEILDCLLEEIEEPEEEEGKAVATGVYTYKGYSITVTASIPLGGGEVTGVVSGTCEGKLRGSYTGQPNGAISGSMSGACSPFFVNIPASASFNGSVNKSGKTVPIGFNGSGGGFKHEGSMTLVYP